MTIVVSQVDIWAHLGSSFELVNVCQGCEQSVLNRTSASTLPSRPRLATSGLLPRRYDSVEAATGKRPQARGPNLPPMIRGHQVVGIVPPSIM